MSLRELHCQTNDGYRFIVFAFETFFFPSAMFDAFRQVSGRRDAEASIQEHTTAKRFRSLSTHYDAPQAGFRAKVHELKISVHEFSVFETPKHRPSWRPSGNSLEYDTGLGRPIILPGIRVLLLSPSASMILGGRGSTIL